MGVSENGDWTSEEYTFTTARPSGETSLYIMGDLQVPGTEEADYELFNAMLDTLKEKEPDASVLVQLGDFVDNAAKYEYWKSLSDYVLEDLGLLTATMSGNHETYNDLNLAHSPYRLAVHAKFHLYQDVQSPGKRERFGRKQLFHRYRGHAYRGSQLHDRAGRTAGMAGTGYAGQPISPVGSLWGITPILGPATATIPAWRSSGKR